MQLTSKETMLVERLRKELRLWPRNRWILLGAGILLGCDGVLGLIWVCRQAFADSVDTDTILDFAFLAPTCLWLAALGERNGMNLGDYKQPEVDYRAVNVKTWSVFFDGRVPMHGNHFAVFVDDQTGEARYSGGR